MILPTLAALAAIYTTPKISFFNIGAGETLEQSLLQLGYQAQITLVFNGRSIEGIPMSHPVRGWMPTELALCIALEGTGVRFFRVDFLTYGVVPPPLEVPREPNDGTEYPQCPQTSTANLPRSLPRPPQHHRRSLPPHTKTILAVPAAPVPVIFSSCDPGHLRIYPQRLQTLDDAFITHFCCSLEQVIYRTNCPAGEDKGKDAPAATTGVNTYSWQERLSGNEAIILRQASLPQLPRDQHVPLRLILSGA